MSEHKYTPKEYNLVAKVLREEFPIKHKNTATTRAQGETCVRIALNFADRFMADNEDFDPLRFLDACSPDTDQFPFSELWAYHKGEA